MNRVLVTAAVLLLSSLARAQVNTCVGTITLTYEDPPGRPLRIGDVLHVRAPFGSGAISGGPVNPPVILYDKVQFDLDCNPEITLVPPCPDIGPIIRYAGDATIVSDCPDVTWTSDNPGGGFLPNQLTFNANPALRLGPDIPNPPGFCTLGFDVTVEAIPPNLKVGEIIGYKLAFCSNGLTSGNFQTAQTTFEVVAEKHLDCYQTPRNNIPVQNVTIDDRFAPDIKDRLSNFHRLCAPSDKNGEDPNAPADPNHFAAAEVTKSTGFVKRTGLTVTTQFGPYTMDVIEPNALLLPASKGLGFNSCTPALPGEHFHCYKLNNLEGAAPKGVTVQDQFLTAPLSVNINLRGSRLCVSADKNKENGGVPPSDKAFLCLRTKGDRLPFPEVKACLTTQFGPQNVTAVQLDELCIEATIN